MSGIACGCASEICAVMGCQRVRQIKEQFRRDRQVPAAAPTFPMIPLRGLTPDDVRRIVREELQRAGLVVNVEPD